jgi:tetratricopeptide (TPR) repeat protein
VDQVEALLARGDHAAARDAARTLLRRRPSDARVLRVLALAHGELREDEQALAVLDHAVASDPGDAGLRAMRASTLRLLGRHADAIDEYGRVIAAGHDAVGVFEGLSLALAAVKREEEALAAMDACVERHPDDAIAWLKAAISRQNAGLVDEAVSLIRRGMERLRARGEPDNRYLLEQLCYLMNFYHDFDPVQHRVLHEALHNAVLAASRVGLARGEALNPERGAMEFANAPDPERPLRVGFVSGDFRLHACAFFTLGMVRAMDPARTFLYSTTAHEDHITTQFQAAGTFRPVRALSDRDLADAIAADEIDVLVDLCGWTDGHRMEAFARRMAPVQVSYLGYPNTTGVAAIDARIVDAITDPPPSREGTPRDDAQQHATERLVRLDRCFLAYSAPTDAPPAFDPRADAARAPDRPIVFGSFNRALKISGGALDLWSVVLRAVPGSRLLIKERQLGALSRRRLVTQLAARGVDPSRVDFAGAMPQGRHLSSYAQADIALDTYPYHGTTTTCEALWMGTPVVTLVGATHRARVGASILSAAGVWMLACHTPERFVGTCVELARSPLVLRDLRASLRGMVARSPLADSRGLARAFDATLREQWRLWCTRASYHRSR